MLYTFLSEHNKTELSRICLINITRIIFINLFIYFSKKSVHLLENNEDFSDDSKSLKEKIAKMKEEIEERKKILKLILENDTNSIRKRGIYLLIQII